MLVRTCGGQRVRESARESTRTSARRMCGGLRVRESAGKSVCPHTHEPWADPVLTGVYNDTELTPGSAELRLAETEAHLAETPLTLANAELAPAES